LAQLDDARPAGRQHDVCMVSGIAPKRGFLRRSLASMTVALLVAACSGVPDATSAPGGTAGPAATTSTGLTFDPGKLDPSTFDPAALADAVVGAASDQARQQAVIAALVGIGLGVYAPDGTPVVAGAERSSTDFIVYDFEVIGLAGGIADGDEVYLDDLAAELSAVNVSVGGSAFSADEFSAAVTQATAAAVADAGNPAGRALRLARELGLRRAPPVDLAQAPSGTPIILDPLAAFLVDADVSLPRILGADPPAAASIGQFASVGDTSALLAAANPCTAFSRQNGSQWYAGMTSIPGSAATNASFSRSLQARLLGGTVKVGKSFEPSWHHLHPGEDPKAKVYFVALQIRAAVPPGIDCGPIRFPRGAGSPAGGGQVVGADVAWTYPGLDRHGQITCGADCSKTDASGVARLFVDPLEEPPPGGIGPAFTKTIPVTAEVNLYQALGPDLFGVLNLPPDMRLFARKEMPTDISWHRAYEIQVAIDSQLYVNKVPAYEFPDHMGTATLSGVLDADTLHSPGDLAYLPPKIGQLQTITDKGTGPLCTVAANGAEGAITVKQRTGSIDFQVIDAVIYPPEEMTLYLDVGPADDYHDDDYRLTQCFQGKVIYDSTSPGTNLWEGTIFRGYPGGLRLSGSTTVDGGPTSDTVPYVWNWRATDQDWTGTGDFVVAIWETPQDCGGYCDAARSWLNIQVLARPLPGP
jgi:hypothetical protein